MSAYLQELHAAHRARRARLFNPPPPPPPPRAKPRQPPPPRPPEEKKVRDEEIVPLAAISGPMKVAAIQRVVARHFNISHSDMMSARRTKNVVWPRQVAMYLAMTLASRSSVDIGRRFGRDHSTILHAVKKIGWLRAKRPEKMEDVEALVAKLTGAAPAADVALDAGASADG